MKIYRILGTTAGAAILIMASTSNIRGSEISELNSASTVISTSCMDQILRLTLGTMEQSSASPEAQTFLNDAGRRALRLYNATFPQVSLEDLNFKVAVLLSSEGAPTSFGANGAIITVLPSGTKENEKDFIFYFSSVAGTPKLLMALEPGPQGKTYLACE